MLLTSGEVADIFQCSEESVRRWCRANKFRAIQTPAGQRIDLLSVTGIPPDVAQRLLSEWRDALTRAAVGHMPTATLSAGVSALSPKAKAQP
jgi:hypothetical protein